MIHADPQRQALRTHLASMRTGLAASDRISAAAGLRNSLDQLPEFMVDERIAGYWTHAGELPLNVALGQLAERGQTFYLPVIGPHRQLHFVPWTVGDDVTPNRYGIPEPTARDGVIAPPLLDLVLVPLLGFDRGGRRLGFGGGYYDTSFAFLQGRKRPASPILVGVGYALQECERIPASTWDVRMDYIATERELIDCTQAA